MKIKLYPILSAFIILATLSACDNDDNENLGNGNDSILKEISKGAALHGTNGLNLGPDGNLYIASFLGREILVMNKQNGKIIKRLGVDVDMKGPDDLAFGPDGSLYWTETLTGEVVRMTPAGVLTKQFVAMGVNPITFSNDGRLFVALDFSGDGLYELDPDLIDPPKGLIVATLANPYPLGFMNGFDFGPDGRLYGPLFLADMVISVNVGEPDAPFSSSPWTDGTIQVVANGFTYPVAAKFNPSGVLHVLDQTGEVFKVNTTTGEKTLFVSLQQGLDNLAFDANGTLYVSNADFGWIIEILPSGQKRTISSGGMIGPGGLAVLPGSNNQDALFVADLFRLREFNGQTGQEENVYKGFLVPEADSLTTTFTVSADGNNVVVSSWFSGLVQVWDPQTEQVLEEHAMAVPINAIRLSDDLAVVDLGLGGVVWASDHSMILPIDNATVFAPGGMATDGQHLWVADWGTGIVWQISFTGNTPNPPTVVATGLLSPEGLAYDQDGSLVVVETGASRLSRINLTTGVATPIVDGLELGLPALEGFPPTWSFDGVAIGQSGDIYVSGFGKNVIYRITEK